MTDGPSILVPLRRPLREDIFPPPLDDALEQLGHVVWNDGQEGLTAAELQRAIAGVDCCITGWGTPSFDEDVLGAADRLRLIAHSAGTVKGLVSATVFERGILVTHAAAGIAEAVADASVLSIWLLLRQLHAFDQRLRAGDSWQEAESSGYGLCPSAQGASLGREMGGRRVGVLGAGHTGRATIRILRALACDVWVYDPYLETRRAEILGVTKVGLDRLLSECEIVTVQLPSTSETYRMLGERELALLPDGAILVNTARSWVLDPDALLAELQSGRIQAALDVFEEEPLPLDSPLRQLSNVLLTPHVAGATVEARRLQGEIIVNEVRRFLGGETLRYRITVDMLTTMA